MKISKNYKGNFGLELQYNLGVPVSQPDAKPDLADRFEWILYVAQVWGGKIQQVYQQRMHVRF